MMDCITARLTVFFEEPFWVGVFERQTAGKLTACKVTFGASPSDGEVYAYFLRNWRTLRFSPPIDGQTVRYVRNPKGCSVRLGERLPRESAPRRSRRFNCSVSRTSGNVWNARGSKKRPRPNGGLHSNSKNAGKSTKATEAKKPLPRERFFQ